MAVREIKQTTAEVVDADTVRIGGDEFKRVRTCEIIYDEDFKIGEELYPVFRLVCTNCGESMWDTVRYALYCPFCGAKVIK